MARRYPCPQCGREMLLEKVHEGFEVPCPACGHRFLVPPGAADEAPPPLGPPAPAGAPPLPPPRRDGFVAASAPMDDGTTAMVVGIVALAFCQLAGPVAWYMGHQVRQQALRAGREPPGMATAGWILGIVSSGLLLLVALGFLVAIGIAAASS